MGILKMGLLGESNEMGSFTRGPKMTHFRSFFNQNIGKLVTKNGHFENRSVG